MDPIDPRTAPPRHKKNHEDPFPLFQESQTPQIAISPSSSDSDSPTSNSNLSRARAKKARKAAHHHQPNITTSTPLRPAKDILSRIRHDPDLGGEKEYVVGYLDRHEREPLEMSVAEWKGDDVTHEEFIPQHRILYFRRVGDEPGRKVWDRASRLDRVFGSGVVGGEEVVEVGAGREGEGVEDGAARQLQEEEGDVDVSEEADEEDEAAVEVTNPRP